MKACIGEMECPGEKLNGGGILRQCYGDLPCQFVGTGWHHGT